MRMRLMPVVLGGFALLVLAAAGPDTGGEHDDRGGAKADHRSSLRGTEVGGVEEEGELIGLGDEGVQRQRRDEGLPDLGDSRLEPLEVEPLDQALGDGGQSRAGREPRKD